MPMPQHTRYERLSEYLMRQQAVGRTRVTLSFTLLEAAILVHPLPPTARSPQYHQWWYADGGHLHAWDGWLHVGWRVLGVSLALETVTFGRAEEG
jgi:hypothetical protein